MGLVMFVKEKTSRDIIKAFDSALAVLRKFSSRSQQSEHYHAILTDLLIDVNNRQQQMASRERASSNRMVSRIFSLHSERATDIDDYAVPDLDEYQSSSEDFSNSASNSGRPDYTSIFPSTWSGIDGATGLANHDNFTFYPWDDFAMVEEGYHP
jgi:hypothetical protein